MSLRVLLAVMALAIGTASAAAPLALAAPPAISATNAILVETSTGDVVFQRGADVRRPIASTTKLMTALLAAEALEPGDVIPAARYQALAVESKIGLRAGERMKVSDLLRGLLIASANDAAVTLAHGVSGSTSRFVRLMNRRARALGLRETRFANPIGLDAPTNYSTARDLVRLTQAAMANPFIARTVDRPGATLRSGDRIRNIVNRNVLVRSYPWVTGVKTGHTLGAGYVLIGSARRAGVEAIAVVLGAPSEAARATDTLALLRYGLARYRRRTVVRTGDVLGSAPVRYRQGAEVDLLAGRGFRHTSRRGAKLRVRIVEAPAELVGPLKARQEVGRAEILQGDKRVGTIPVVVARTVPEATVPQRAKDVISRPVLLVALLALALFGFQTLYLARQRAKRRAAHRRRPRRRVAA